MPAPAGAVRCHRVTTEPLPLVRARFWGQERFSPSHHSWVWSSALPALLHHPLFPIWHIFFGGWRGENHFSLWVSLTRGCVSPASGQSQQLGALGGLGDFGDPSPPPRSHSPSLPNLHLPCGAAAPNDRRRPVPHLQRAIFGRAPGEKERFPCCCSVISINYRGL